MADIQKGVNVNTNINFTGASQTGDITNVNKTEARQAESYSRQVVNSEEFDVNDNETNNYNKVIFQSDFNNQNIFEWISDAVGSFLSKININDSEERAVQFLNEHGINVDRSQVIGIDDGAIYLTNGTVVVTSSSGNILGIRCQYDDTFDGELYVSFNEDGEIRFVNCNYDGDTIFINNFDDFLLLINSYGLTLGNISSITEDSIILNRNGIEYEVYVSGDLYSIFEGTGESRRLIAIIKNGNVLEPSADTMSILNDISMYTGQYGGNQMTFRYDIDKLMNDERIMKSVMDSFPELNACTEEVRLQIIESYFDKLCEGGCGYIAVINSLFEQYQGREQEFEEIFGFPMYNIDDSGFPDYNYEYLVVAFANFVWSNSDYNIFQVSGYDGSSVSILMRPETREQFEAFLRVSYGLNVNINNIYTLRGTYTSQFLLENFDESFQTQYILSASNFTLEGLDGVEMHVSSGHDMYVTGITEDGQIEVSSWGEKYFIDLSDVEWAYIAQVTY